RVAAAHRGGKGHAEGEPEPARIDDAVHPERRPRARRLGEGGVQARARSARAGRARPERRVAGRRSRWGGALRPRLHGALPRLHGHAAVFPGVSRRAPGAGPRRHPVEGAAGFARRRPRAGKDGHVRRSGSSEQRADGERQRPRGLRDHRDRAAPRVRRVREQRAGVGGARRHRADDRAGGGRDRGGGVRRRTVSPLRESCDPVSSTPRSLWRQAMRSLTCSFLQVLLLAAAPAFAYGQQPGEQGFVAGTVVAEGSLRPLPAVQVSAGEGRTAFTDAAGRFRITGLGEGQVKLTTRIIGYLPLSRSVSVGNARLLLTLVQAPIELNAVVVKGTAGDEEKPTIGNVVPTINAADVTAVAPVSDVQSLINGRAPGVEILPGTGQAGSGSKVRIRGISSLSLLNNPLLY